MGAGPAVCRFAQAWDTGRVADTTRDVALRVSGQELDTLRQGLELLREQLEYTVRNESPGAPAAVDAAQELNLVSNLEALLDRSS
jgi:hypothetical protein